MRAAVLYDSRTSASSSGRFPIGRGELLVKTRASGICSGDVMAWYIRRKDSARARPRTGGRRRGNRRGRKRLCRGRSRVRAPSRAVLFVCRLQPRRLRAVRDVAQNALDPGGLAEYFRVPRENTGDTLRLPESVPLSMGPRRTAGLRGKIAPPQRHS